MLRAVVPDALQKPAALQLLRAGPAAQLPRDKLHDHVTAALAAIAAAVATTVLPVLLSLRSRQLTPKVCSA